MSSTRKSHGSNNMVRRELAEIVGAWGFEEVLTCLMDLHEEQADALDEEDDIDGVREMRRAIKALDAVRSVYDGPR
jgi:hypothetical protein